MRYSSIRAEIAQVDDGVWPIDDNPLGECTTCHSMELVQEWSHSYSRECAVFPK